MTEIDFYSHAPDRDRLACILAGKAFKSGKRVFMLMEDAAATERMEKLLWTLPPEGFLPHCRPRHELADVTPVIIDHDPVELPHDQIFFNFQHPCPDYFGRFERLIEIVGNDAAGLQAARERWRFYKSRGYPVRNHDMRDTRLT